MRLLALASRPSDLVEIADTAVALAAAGHQVTLVHLCPPADGGRQAVMRILGDTPAPARQRFDALWVDLLAVHRGDFDAPGPLLRSVRAYDHEPLVTPQAAPPAPGLAAKIVRRLRDPRGTLAVVSSTLPTMVRIGRRVPPRLWPSLFTTARRLADTRLVYGRFLRLFGRLVDEVGAEALLIPEDVVGPIWPLAIAASHARRVPALVLPYTLATAAEAIQSLKSEAGFQTGRNAVAAHLFPRWRHHAGAIDIVRLPSAEILAHEEFGVSPPDPWMVNSGFADRILVDSRAAFEYYREGGIPAGQMAVVGSVSQDRMYRLRQDRARALGDLRNQLGLSGAKPLLLLSGCPNQLSAEVPSCEFRTMEDVAAFVGGCVARLGDHYHLVVRPHPNFMEFGPMLSRFGVRVAEAPTASLVPLADVFVAFASATIRWALACGVPVVNYDVFHYGYGDFSSARGVASVQRGQDFSELLAQLPPGSSRYLELAEGAASDRDHWSVMDGRSVERIEQEIIVAKEQRTHA